MGSLGIITSLVSVMIYGTLGYILGGPRIATKRSLAFDTGIRNEAAALLIVVVFGMMQLIIMGVLLISSQYKILNFVSPIAISLLHSSR